MKLVLAVVQRQDAGELLDSLTAQGLRVTRISSEGGFLREGNVTLLIAVEDRQVEPLLQSVREHCYTRTRYVSPLPPLAGVVLHMILRPRQTLTEKYERSLEEEYLRRDLEEKYVCPHCQRGIEPDFVMCPHCHTALRRRCGVCDRVVDLTWSICPYCGDDGSAPAAHPNYRRQRSP